MNHDRSCELTHSCDNVQLVNRSHSLEINLEPTKAELCSIFRDAQKVVGSDHLHSKPSLLRPVHKLILRRLFPSRLPHLGNLQPMETARHPNSFPGSVGKMEMLRVLASK